MNNSPHLPFAPSPLNIACNTPRFYYTAPELYPSLRETLGMNELKENLIAPYQLTALRVMATYSMRSCELLSLTVGHYIGASRFFLCGAKGSRGAVVFLPDISKCIDPLGADVAFLRIFPFGYIQLYRWSVKIGVCKDLNGHQNSAVTHASRYCVAEAVDNIFGESAVTDALRHRSVNSAQYYTNKKE
jgi:integrase